MLKHNEKSYLVETALLGQGLISVRSEQVLEAWPADALVTWMQNGRIVIRSIDDLRDNTEGWRRLDGLTLNEGMKAGLNAFLTASATMAVAGQTGYPIVVTAGMGGIGDIIGERLCYDLPALAQTEITLVATSPKDMLDIPGTIDWLHHNGVKTYGVGTAFCDGYVFAGQKTKLMHALGKGELASLPRGHNLLLNPIPHEKRLTNLEFLKEAIQAGKHAEKIGQPYHPAANRRLDELSQGWSSQIQLDSLLANTAVARNIKVYPN
jgi:pseudouridine-5'-phosphate glycosidase